MLTTDIPSKIVLPFAAGASPSFIRVIPVASQIGVQAGAASFTDGFPPDCFTPIGAGGVPPFGVDFNGLMNQETAWSRWYCAGASVPFDAAFSSSVSGYPKDAIVKAIADGYFWYNTVDGNTTNPETGGAGWVSYSIYGPTTGDVKWRPTSEQIPGWVVANALSIGNAASGATGLASASAAALFAWHWNNFPNSQCPVSGGRGANAAADFAANKNITTLDFKGTMGFLGVDTMGGGATTRLSGVPTVNGNATTPGSVLGENLHSLVAAENANHSHGVTDPTHSHAMPFVFGTSSGPAATTAYSGAGLSTSAAATGISIQSQGAGTAHNTVQRSMAGYVYLKL